MLLLLLPPPLSLLWWSVCRWTCDRGYRWLPPLVWVCPLFNVLDAIPPIIVVATCVSFLDHAPFLANETEAETRAHLYIKSPLVCLCTRTPALILPTLLPPCSIEDTMKLNLEKVELQPRPRPALSPVSTSPRVSELEDAASARERDADEFSLVQLHHRLELECLPPVDQGKHAYLFLLACFILEALIWGKATPTSAFLRPPPFSPSLRRSDMMSLSESLRTPRASTRELS